MDQTSAFFAPHPNLSDRVNHNIIQSEVEGGVHLSTLPRDARLEMLTQHHAYTMVHLGEGEMLIWGHPEFCPEPVVVKLTGSNWGGTMLKAGYIGRGMRLEFRHPEYTTLLITSHLLY